jgi:hypothetical protein
VPFMCGCVNLPTWSVRFVNFSYLPSMCPTRVRYLQPHCTGRMRTWMFWPCLLCNNTTSHMVPWSRIASRPGCLLRELPPGLFCE